jgi:hypothetical protein
MLFILGLPKITKSNRFQEVQKFALFTVLHVKFRHFCAAKNTVYFEARYFRVPRLHYFYTYSFFRSFRNFKTAIVRIVQKRAPCSPFFRKSALSVQLVQSDALLWVASLATFHNRFWLAGHWPLRARASLME